MKQWRILGPSRLCGTIQETLRASNFQASRCLKTCKSFTTTWRRTFRPRTTVSKLITKACGKSFLQEACLHIPSFAGSTILSSSNKHPRFFALQGYNAWSLRRRLCAATSALSTTCSSRPTRAQCAHCFRRWKSKTSSRVSFALLRGAPALKYFATWTTSMLTSNTK